MTTHKQTPDQIEREIEDTRSKIDQNLDALQNKVSPGELIDEAVGYVKESGGDIAEGITRTIRENPIPATLIGAGIGLFLLSKASNASRNASESLSSSGAKSADRSGHGNSLPGRASDMRDHVVDSASAAAENLDEKTSEIADAAKTKITAVRDRTVDYADRGRDKAREVASASGRFAGEHPFVLAALGLAAGAGVAALVRSSNKENELLGGKSDRVKEIVKETAKEQSEKVKVAAEAAARRAKEEAVERGFTEKQAKEKANDLLQEGREIAGAAGAAATSQYLDEQETAQSKSKKSKASAGAVTKKTTSSRQRARSSAG